MTDPTPIAEAVAAVEAAPLDERAAAYEALAEELAARLEAPANPA